MATKRVSKAEAAQIAIELDNGMWDESPIPTTPEMKARSKATWERLEAERLESAASDDSATPIAESA